MRLTTCKFYRYRLPLSRPLAVRGSDTTTRDGALLMVESSKGAMGWGDIAPLPGFSPESLDQAVGVARTRLDSLMGRDLLAPDILQRPSMTCASAAFGLDSAVLDCMATEAGIPPGLVFADEVPASVAVNALVDGDPELAVAEARRAVDQGYRTIKIKVGRRDPTTEAEMVRRARTAIGPDVALRLDANRAWTLPQAKCFFDALGDTEIEYIEEPLRNPSELPGLSVPLALDETLAEQGWEDLGAVAAVIKPSAQDGVAGALRLARAARMHGLMPVVSSLFESGVGIRMLSLLAGAMGHPGCAHGLDTLRWFAEDVAEPAPTIVRGQMTGALGSMYILNQRVVAPGLPGPQGF